MYRSMNMSIETRNLTRIVYVLVCVIILVVGSFSVLLYFSLTNQKGPPTSEPTPTNSPVQTQNPTEAPTPTLTPQPTPTPTPPHPELTLQVYEPSVTWSRGISSDLPTQTTTIGWTVTNIGNATLISVEVIVYLEGHPFGGTQISNLQPGQRSIDSLSGVLVRYDQTEDVYVKATSGTTFTSQNYTIMPSFPRSESAFQGNNSLYKLYVTPADSEVQSQKNNLILGLIADSMGHFSVIRNWVSQHIIWTTANEQVWQLPRETLSAKIGNSEDTSVLMVSLLRADSWSTNDVYVFLATNNTDGTNHAFTKVKISNTWYCWDLQSNLFRSLNQWNFSSEFTVKAEFNDQYFHGSGDFILVG